jgi:hypothetical protein
LAGLRAWRSAALVMFSSSRLSLRKSRQGLL